MCVFPFFIYFHISSFSSFVCYVWGPFVSFSLLQSFSCFFSFSLSFMLNKPTNNIWSKKKGLHNNKKHKFIGQENENQKAFKGNLICSSIAKLVSNFHKKNNVPPSIFFLQDNLKKFLSFLSVSSLFF